jgi:pilus assembly protein CpaF
MDFLNSIMMYDEKRLKQNEPLVNARTIQGYRVSATHPSVFAAHPTEPTVTWPTATTIRIPTAQSFSEEDFIKNNTFCKEMSDTIKLFARSLVPVAVVGSTGSGKSTILDFIASNFDDRHRTIFIQDPAEINKRKIVDGVMVNNAIYWEADDTADPDNHNSATVYNMIVHSLRNSPDNLCLGEIRRSSEFGAASNAAQTGHVFTTTFHAGSDIGALDRFALEMFSHRRIDIYIAREMVCEFLPIIIHIERLGDGTRKILKITEVKGYDRTKNEYIINPLFKFRIKDTVLVDGNKRITGDFVQLNNISPELEDKLLKAAIPRSDINKIKLPEGERERVIKEVRYENAKELS